MFSTPSAFLPNSSKLSSSTWNWSTKSRFPRFSSRRGPSGISPLTLGFAYAFDLFMNAFIEQPREFPSPFCPETPFAAASVPRFSDSFHEIAALLASPACSSLYDRFKSFCMALWTDFLSAIPFTSGTPQDRRVFSQFVLTIVSLLLCLLKDPSFPLFHLSQIDCWSRFPRLV